jgi:hypothetical protein
MDWTQFWQVVAVPVGSGLLGWFQNAAEDGEFTKYEIMMGVETVIKLGAPALALWIIGNGFGIDLQAYVAAAIPVAIYWVRKLFKVKA